LEVEMTDETRKALTKYIYGKVIFDGNFFGFTGQGDMRPIRNTSGDLVD